MSLEEIDSMTVVKYIGRVYEMGKDPSTSKIVISVPKDDRSKVKPLIGKKVVVSLQEVEEALLD